jgi:tetratricopeptide (TPR) repeat protein
VLGAGGVAAIAALSAAAYPVVGYWRTSETLFRQALRVDPLNWVAHNNLGVLLVERGDTAEGITYLRAALDIFPGNEEARYTLAVALEGQGAIQPAIAEYQRLLEGSPGHPLAHNNLGSLLARTGRLDEAVAHFEAAARILPENSGIRMNLARARKARDERQRQLQLAPETAEP